MYCCGCNDVGPSAKLEFDASLLNALNDDTAKKDALADAT
jgi:hypothetical protein